MISFFMAALCLQAGKSAEETFNAITDSVGKATTLVMSFTSESTRTQGGESIRATGSGLLLVKQKKVFLSWELNQAGEKSTFSFLSDGKTIRGRARSFGADHEIDQSDSFTSNVLTTAVRFGPSSIAADLSYAFFFDKSPQPKVDVGTLHRVAKLKFGGDEEKAKSIDYTLESNDDTTRGTIDVALWYEPGTSKLLKRKLRFNLPGDVAGEGVEKYGEFTLNSDIPDDRFKLPE